MTATELFLKKYSRLNSVSMTEDLYRYRHRHPDSFWRHRVAIADV